MTILRKWKSWHFVNIVMRPITKLSLKLNLVSVGASCEGRGMGVSFSIFNRTHLSWRPRQLWRWFHALVASSAIPPRWTTRPATLSFPMETFRSADAADPVEQRNADGHPTTLYGMRSTRIVFLVGIADVWGLRVHYWSRNGRRILSSRMKHQVY